MSAARTLLGVWAHPDDEAYLSAGLMATFRKNGHRVVVVTATLGEHGTSDPERWPPGRLARRRRIELRRSLAVLGVHELRLLGFEDGDCVNHDATAMVADQIVDVQPEVIVTFGPDGVTGHPDHIAVHHWATDAWRATGSRAELWYPTFPDEFHDQWGTHNQQIGLWADQPHPPRADASEILHQPGTWRSELKFEALRAHRSQTAGLIDMVGESTYRRWWRDEWFVAAPTVLDDVDVSRRVTSTAAR